MDEAEIKQVFDKFDANKDGLITCQGNIIRMHVNAMRNELKSN